MQNVTGFALMYAGIGAALWAVVGAGTEGSVTPLQASAAPAFSAPHATLNHPSPSATEGSRSTSRPATRWLGRLGTDLDREFECLALNIYWEARSEPSLGQFAVAAVTLNRVAASSYPNSVCEVVQQGGEQRLHRCQFSWWCDGKSDNPLNDIAWSTARAVAYTVLFFDPPDPTHGALWYHADYVNPSWARALSKVTKIGRHIYYRESPRGRKIFERTRF